MKETDLYPILKHYFEDMGYIVQAEVNSVDIVAIKEEMMIIVEMKTQLNLKLIYQGCQRQKISDNVYLAVPTISNKKTFKERMHILRRLNLGLIVVDIKKEKVEVILDPTEFVFRKIKKRKNKLLKEINKRQTNINIGGTTRTKLVTAYRENVIRIAYHLQNGPKSTKELRELTNTKNVANILQKNYYGWFDRLNRGIYTLNEKGMKELQTYEQLFKDLNN